MDRMLLSPPLAFIVVLSATLFLSFLFSKISFKPKKAAQAARKNLTRAEKIIMTIQSSLTTAIFLPLLFSLQ